MAREKLGAVLALLALAMGACSPMLEPTPTPARTAVPATASPTKAAAAGPTTAPVTATTTAKPTTAPAAGATTPKYGGVLKASLGADLTAWDPHSSSSNSRDIRKTQNMVFQQLFIIAGTATDPCQLGVAPQLAKSWRWAGDNAFEVTIPEGIRFQDLPPVNGRELTAEDVAFSMNRYKELTPTAVSIAKNITDVKPMDRYTVRFVTSTPLPALYYSWLSAPFGAAVLAKESAGPIKGKEYEFPWKEKSWVGTGPFQFKDYLSGVKITFEKNPSYWKKGLPYVDRLEHLIIPDESTRFALFRSGNLTVWLDQLPVPLAQSLERTMPQVKLSRCADPTNVRIFMRTDKPPFNDVRVRRAISMAVNRKAWLEVSMLGEGIVPAFVSPIAPFFLGLDAYPPELRRYLEYNPQEAKRLLAEAGYPNGFKMKLSEDRNDGFPWVQVAESTAAMLADVGLQVELRFPPRAEATATLSQGEYDDMAWAKATSLDFYTVAGRMHSKAGWRENRGHIVDPVLDDLIDRFMSTVDEKKALDLATKIQFYAVEQAYTISAPFQTERAVAQPWVRDLAVNGMPRFGDWAEKVWLDR